MASFEFRGFVSVAYPGLRDARDQPVGLVEPGDVREFTQAPDHMWSPAGRGDTGSDPDPADVPAPAPGSEGAAGEPHDADPETGPGE